MPNIQGRLALDKLSYFENICKHDPHTKGLISNIYAQLISKSDSSPPTYVAKWESDLGFSLETTKWDTIWTTTKSSSQNIAALETNYKVLTRWYLVPTRIAKFAPNYSSSCFRGCTEPGSHFHTWWTCPIIKRFWEIIFRMISTLFAVSILLIP